MKKKIIISGADKMVNPWTAFGLSLALTGLGQVYRGRAARGIAFTLIRVIAIISVPCYAVLNPAENAAAEIAAAGAVFLLATIMSPIEALAGALRSGRIKKKRYNSAASYTAFTAASLALTALSMLLFFSCFTFHRTAAAFPPLVEQGDILIFNKMKRSYIRGEAVIDVNLSMLRIIALPGDTLSCRNSKLSVNGEDLQRSVYTEDELNTLGLQDKNVTTEYNGLFRYAVMPSGVKFTVTIKAGENTYCAAFDERKNPESFLLLPGKSITASLEGILISPSRKLMLILPQMPAR